MNRLIILATLTHAGWAWSQPASLPFQVEAASYWEPEEGPYAKIRISLAYDELLFVKGEDGFTATYTASYRIATDKGERVHTGNLSGAVQVFSFAETNARNMLAHEEIRLRLPPGSYVVSVTMEDRENKRSGTRQQTLVMEPPKSSGLQLSSLMLLGCMEDRQALSDTLPDPCGALTVAAELYAFGDTSETVLPVRVEVSDARGKSRIEQSDSILVSGALTMVEMFLGVTRLEAGSYQVQMSVGTHDPTTTARHMVVPWSIWTMVNRYDDAHRLLSYIAEKDEVRRFKKLAPQDRTEFWHAYWDEHDPVPSTPRNELVEMYEARIMYANDNFSAFEEGWKTDMGMVHVRFGPPDDIERHPFDRNNKPYEIWSYHSLKREFVFVDRTGFGRYDMVQGDLSRW